MNSDVQNTTVGGNADTGIATDHQQITADAANQNEVNTQTHNLTFTSTGESEPQTDNSKTLASSKTYSNDDYQKMATAQYAAGLAAAMKEAGFEPTKGEDFKKQMKAFREWQTSQKTELERANDARTVAEDALADAQAKALAYERQIAAIGKGVPSDKAQKYIKLAESYLEQGGDFDKALAAALEDFPLPQAKETVPRIVLGAQKTPSANAKDAFNFNFQPVRPTSKK